MPKLIAKRTAFSKNRPSVVDWRTLAECRPQRGDAVLIRYQEGNATRYLVGTWIEYEFIYVTDGRLVIDPSIITGWSLIHPRSF